MEAERPDFGNESTGEVAVDLPPPPHIAAHDSLPRKPGADVIAASMLPELSGQESEEHLRKSRTAKIAQKATLASLGSSLRD